MDKGVAGNSADRQGLRDALSIFRDGQADVLIVTNISRVSRSVAALAEMIDAHFADGSHALITLDEQLDTRTPLGRLMLHTLSTLTRWESEAVRHA